MDGLLAVGGILNCILGAAGLLLMRRGPEMPWNKHMAGQLICWVFIAKGIANIVRAPGWDHDYWRVTLFMGVFADDIWSYCVLMIAVIFPIPFVRNEFHVKALVISVGTVLVASMLVFSFAGLDNFLRGMNTYPLAGALWTIGYLRFRIIPPEERTEEMVGVADAAFLLMMMFFGHIWFRWVGMWTFSDYFYFLTISDTSMAANYLWSAGMAASVICGMVVLATELRCTYRGDVRWTSYLCFVFFTLGVVSHLIYWGGHGILDYEVDGSGDVWAWGEELRNDAQVAFLSSFEGIWNSITTLTHFTLGRPLIGMYLLLRYGLTPVTEDNRGFAKVMSIVLIVVATSAVLEIFQSLIPITEMLSAALLGIIVAFGIGWEERSFDALVKDPKDLPVTTHSELFPSIDLDRATIMKMDLVFLVFIGFNLLIAFTLHAIGVDPGVILP